MEDLLDTYWVINLSRKDCGVWNYNWEDKWDNYQINKRDNRRKEQNFLNPNRSRALYSKIISHLSIWIEAKVILQLSPNWKELALNKIGSRILISDIQLSPRLRRGKQWLDPARLDLDSIYEEQFEWIIYYWNPIWIYTEYIELLTKYVQVNWAKNNLGSIIGNNWKISGSIKNCGSIEVSRSIEDSICWSYHLGWSTTNNWENYLAH